MSEPTIAEAKALTPYWADEWTTLYLGDCREVLRSLPAESVHCVVTSPPYWGLRDYGIEPSVWPADHLRGATACLEREHEWGEFGKRAKEHGGGAGGHWQDAGYGGSITKGTVYPDAIPPQDIIVYQAFCLRCGAWRGSLGLEPTPELYVAHIVECFREVWRVLRKDGTCFVNLGDSYFASGQRAGRSGTGGRGRPDSTERASASGNLCGECANVLASRNPDSGCHPCVELPASSVESTHSHKKASFGHRESFRLASQGGHSATATLGPLLAPETQSAVARDALASTTAESSRPLQGACLHCVNCGACPSVLASVERDARACARTAQYMLDSGRLGSVDRNRGTGVSDSAYPYYTTASLKPKDLLGMPWRVAFALQADGWWLRSDIIWSKPNPMPESVTDRPTRSHEYMFLLTKEATYYYDQEAIREGYAESTLRDARDNKDGQRRDRQFPGQASVGGTNLGGLRAGGRNKRSVWEIATQPFPDAHFATFPEALVTPCIQAGTSERGCCPECGAHWERVVDHKSGYGGARRHDSLEKYGLSQGSGWKDNKQLAKAGAFSRTLGWRPTCKHKGEPIPTVVLDPFSGSGTVGVIARKAGRRNILIDLKAEYLEMARERCAQGVLL